MTALAADLTAADLETLVVEVWATYAAGAGDLEPAPAADWAHTDAPSGSPCWSAAVSVTGGWHGMVTVDLAADAADVLARAMLALDDAEPLATADVADAVAELVNIVGGNVKALVPGPSQLSLPVVATSPVVVLSDLHLQHALDLQWRSSPLRVRVFAAAR